MIEIRNVSFHIGERPILNDVSLNIPEGGITALIGAPLFMKLLFGSGGNFGGSR